MYHLFNWDYQEMAWIWKDMGTSMPAYRSNSLNWWVVEQGWKYAPTFKAYMKSFTKMCCTSCKADAVAETYVPTNAWHMVKTVAISQEAESRKNKVSMEERQGINLDVCNQLQQQQQISQHKGLVAIELLPPSMRVPSFHDHNKWATDMIGLQPHEQNGQWKWRKVRRRQFSKPSGLLITGKLPIALIFVISPFSSG